MAIPNNEKNTYILITQCLQNGFFFAEENRLCLPRDVVARMLVGYGEDPDNVIEVDASTNKRKIKEKSSVDGRKDLLKNGPLYQFLKSLVEADNTPSNVHIINIRDWHTPSNSYDHERRLYGIHCEACTWEAEYLDGFEEVLYPFKGDAEKAKEARSVEGYQHEVSSRPKNQVTFYDVLSDSVFDFKRPDGALQEETQQVLGSENKQHDTLLSAILDKLIKGKNSEGNEGRVYVVVIGVYTDIKVKTLLIGLRTRYPEIKALLVSDVLTGAPTIERHVEALDFLDKVLWVEVVHSLTELIHVLEPTSKDFLHKDLIKNQLDFGQYRTYSRDRQMILADQDNSAKRYLDMTGKRSERIYRTISEANEWLIRTGKGLLFLSVFLLLMRSIQGWLNEQFSFSLDIPNEALTLIGGLTIAQLLTSFFLIPQAQLRNNLNALVRLRNYLETYSSISALLRYHMTKLNSLNLPAQKAEQEMAEKELEMLRKRIEIIQESAKSMSETFKDVPLSSS